MNKAWTVHCPDCQTEVGVVGSPERVTCAQCESVFQPEGLQTTIQTPQAKLVPDPLIGKRVGPWQLVRLIGRGGMGTVYEARDARRDRRVALKILRDDLASDPGFVKRFHRESKVLGRLSHPHIVEVLEQGEDDGQLWFSMEYVRGESLRQRMARGPLAYPDATRIAHQISSALAYAHEQGVVHRDLKPENVLLDEDGMVRLVDFGLSKLVDDGRHGATTHLTRTDVIMGTYEYMAPEQRRGDRSIDGRADVFSLGVILYEMLTGTLPLGRFALPSETDVGAPRAFDVVVTKALAMRASDRYPSAMAFQSDLVAAGVAGAKTGPAPRPTPLPAVDAAAERKVHRHIEILSALDRVGGFMALLAALGGLPFLLMFAPVSTPLVVVLFIIGVWLMQQGGRLSRMEPGSRESQVTASIFLLFFPPFLTALGIYSLIVMTSDAARRAIPSERPTRGPFKRHRRHEVHARAWAPPAEVTPTPVATPPAPTPAPAPHQSVVAQPLYSEPRRVLRKAPSWLLRGFLFLMILWTINSVLVLLDVEAFRRNMLGIDFDAVQALVMTAVILSIVAFMVLVYQFMIRKRREGLLLAFFALLLAGASMVMMVVAWDEHPHRRQFYRSTTWLGTVDGIPVPGSSVTPQSIIPIPAAQPIPTHFAPTTHGAKTPIIPIHR